MGAANPTHQRHHGFPFTACLCHLWPGAPASNPVDFSVKPLREWTWEIFPYKKYQAMLRAREDEATPKW